MKKTALFFIFLLSLSLSYSQSPKDSTRETLCGLTNEDFFTKSDIVIRGDWLGTQGKYETIINGKMDTMVVFGYRVSEIYKGEQSLRWQTIFVLVEKNKVFNYPKRYDIQGPDYRPEIPQSLQDMGISSGYSYNMPSIFFLSKSDVVDDGCPEKFPSGKRYVFVCDEMSRLFVFEDKILGLNDLVFQKESELFDYMEQFEGFDISPYKPQPRRKAEPEKDEIEYQKISPVEMDSAQMKIMEERWSGDIKKKALTHPAKSGGSDLTLQMANQRVVHDSAANKYYVKFDLLVSSNNPNIFFDGVDLRIGYDTTIFGPNIFIGEPCLFEFKTGRI